MTIEIHKIPFKDIEHQHKVYCHINKINGKMYVGITKQKLKARWDNGKGYKCYFKNAIDKYGWDNFEHELIASNLTKEEAYNFEIVLIDKLNLTNTQIGYNVSKGGEANNKGIRISERPNFVSLRGASSPIKRTVYQFTLEGILVKKWDCIGDAERALGFSTSSIVNVCKGRKKQMYGFLWGYTENPPTYNKPIYAISSIPVCKFSLSGELISTYPSIKNACKGNNLSYDDIHSCCKSANRLSSGGFKWCFEGDEEKIQAQIKNLKPNCKKILQYSTNGVLIKKHNSARDAHIDTGATLRHIYSVCDGDRKYCGGFIWKYAN